jgi:hypothetical protein
MLGVSPLQKANRHNISKFESRQNITKEAIKFSSLLKLDAGTFTKFGMKPECVENRP